MWAKRINSMDTVLTFDNRELEDQGSVIWSTSNITDLETTRSTQMRMRGRRRLRVGSLALSALLTMHLRIPSSALAGGTFFFMLFLVGAVAAVANPVRHFEIYLGQWSISGPGRAFRIIPMLDGIGIAMCINAIVRAIICCTIAALTSVYVFHTTADAALPFTHCRAFNLTAYTPHTVTVPIFRDKVMPSTNNDATESATVGLKPKAWRNTSYTKRAMHKVEVCNETYSTTYPPLFSTPAYNFFCVEVAQLREFKDKIRFNIPLVVALIVAWLVLWLFMILEKLSYGRIVYNNIKQWFLLIPWIWCLLLVFQGAFNVNFSFPLRKIFSAESKDVVARLTDAFQVALYIHSLSYGTELIHGKTLHNYAAGHIDPLLNDENLWHSGLVLILTGLHAAGAALCALADSNHSYIKHSHKIKESILWIIPMYSKCTSLGSYSHLMSTLVFGGLVFSHMTVAYYLLKTALHTIFEYRVKFVFVEQFVIGGLISICMGLSMIFTINGGIEYLESVDALMSGIAISFVVILELVCLMYVYSSQDFQSDLDLSTEDNTWASRIGLLLKVAPIITLIMLSMKLTVLPDAEMDSNCVILATIPLIAMMVALPIRAARNAYTYLRPARGSTPH